MSGGVVIMFVEQPSPELRAQAPPPGVFVASYDPDALEGQGWCELTTDPAEAHVYPTRDAALAAWRQRSTIRPDLGGQENRPMARFRVELRDVRDLVARG